MDDQSGAPAPEQHLTDWSKKTTRVGGQPYLEVKYRIAMLREKHPDADIHTDLIEHKGIGSNQASAVFRAEIEIPDGGSATGWGSESFEDFRDYLEKAETKALGRAAAALGFGTLEANFNDPALARMEGNRRQNNRQQNNRNQRQQPPPEPKRTKEQIAAIEAWRVREGVSKNDIREIIKYVAKRPVEELNRADADTVLFALNNHPIEELYGWKKG